MNNQVNENTDYRRVQSTINDEEPDTNDVEEQEHYRKERKQDLIEASIAEPVFVLSQFFSSLFHHIMFQLFLGPIWSLVLAIFKGKTYVVNYGFWFGVFNFSFTIGIVQYFATVYTIYLLIDETYFSPEVPDYEKNIQLYPTLTLIASILFRQVVICIRHGSEQPHVHNA